MACDPLAAVVFRGSQPRIREKQYGRKENTLKRFSGGPRISDCAASFPRSGFLIGRGKKRGLVRIGSSAMPHESLSRGEDGHRFWTQSQARTTSFSEERTGEGCGGTVMLQEGASTRERRGSIPAACLGQLRF